MLVTPEARVRRAPGLCQPEVDVRRSCRALALSEEAGALVRLGAALGLVRPERAAELALLAEAQERGRQVLAVEQVPLVLAVEQVPLERAHRVPAKERRAVVRPMDLGDAGCRPSFGQL